MSNDDLDAATLAHYRQVIERAAAGDPSARGATAAVFAALDRRDARDKEMRNIVWAVADMTPDDCPMYACWERSEHTTDCIVTRARALLAR
jgi:hypothetical protein